MQLDTVSQQYSSFDVKMTWDAKRIDGKTVVDGFVKNIRYATMEDIEIWVALLDADEKTVCRAVDFVLPRRLDRDESAAFKVEFPVAVLQGAKLVFTYKYEGCDGGDGLKWMQSFEASVP